MGRSRSPACASFRQFFKIKSLSVLVKCISRGTPATPPARPSEGPLSSPPFRYRPRVPRERPTLLRELLCHSTPVDPRAAPNDRQLAAKKVCKSAGTRQTETRAAAAAADRTAAIVPRAVFPAARWAEGGGGKAAAELTSAVKRGRTAAMVRNERKRGRPG